MQEARRYFEDSLALIPTKYETIKELLATLTKLGDRNATLALMGRLLCLDPHNPTVFDDCILYARHSAVTSSDLLSLFEHLRANFPDDQLVQANSDFYTAKILLNTDPVSARKKLIAAQRAFRQVFPRGHQVFVALRSVLRQL